MSVKPLDLQVNIQNTLEVARLESFKQGKEINDSRASENRVVKHNMQVMQDVPATNEAEIMTELTDKFDSYDEEKQINPEQRRNKKEQKRKTEKKNEKISENGAQEIPKHDGKIDFLA